MTSKKKMLEVLDCKQKLHEYGAEVLPAIDRMQIESAQETLQGSMLERRILKGGRDGAR
jgi:hypothetical protein